MDIGDGIAIGSFCIAAAPVCIVAIRAKKSGNGHCQEHSGVCQRVDGFEDWLQKIENKLDRVIEGRVGK